MKLQKGFKIAVRSEYKPGKGWPWITGVIVDIQPSPIPAYDNHTFPGSYTVQFNEKTVTYKYYEQKLFYPPF